MLDVKRQRRAALHRDVSIEFGRFDDAQQFNAGETAMGNGELIDDGDTKPGLDQCADRSAEPAYASSADSNHAGKMRDDFAFSRLTNVIARPGILGI